MAHLKNLTITYMGVRESSIEKTMLQYDVLRDGLAMVFGWYTERSVERRLVKL